MRNLIYLLLAMSLIITAGCGKKNDGTAGSDKKEQTDEKKKESGDNKTEIKTNDLGIATGLPENYPKDIPEVKGSKVIGYIKTNEGTLVTQESTANFKDIVEDFKSGMKANGWSVTADAEMNVSDKLVIMGWNKDKQEVSFTATLTEEGKTSVLITFK